MVALVHAKEKSQKRGKFSRFENGSLSCGKSKNVNAIEFPSGMQRKPRQYLCILYAINGDPMNQ